MSEHERRTATARAASSSPARTSSRTRRSAGVPGCGDYGILAAIQFMLPETGVKPEDLVFVSGIGCAAALAVLHEHLRHPRHPRARAAIATGVALARPDLHVWVIGGDGDMLSIGGNHLIHALRRNVNLKILMFNNQIYGLTKGQYSPTSEIGKVTKSTPFGSLDQPFNPISVALGAEATFVARTHDMDRKHMIEMFRRAHEHQGAAFVEMYQNCNVFNDGAFDTILNKDARPNMLIDLKHGEPIRFGNERELGRRDERVRRGDDRQRRRRRRGPARRARRAPAPTRRSRSRCRGSPTSRRRRRRSACSARSSGRATRSRCSGSSSRRPQERPRRPRRAAALRPDLDGRLSPTVRRARASVERAEDHAGARLGREERRLLRHAGPVERPRRGSGRPRPGEQQDRGATRRPCRRARRRRARRGGSATSRRAAAGTTSASTTAASVAATAGCSPRARSRDVRAGTRECEPAASTRPSPCSSRMRAGQRVDVLGGVRAGVAIANASASACRGRRRRRAGRAAGGSARCRARRRPARRRSHDRVGAADRRGRRRAARRGS